MLSQIQDLLLTILLPLAGAAVGYQFALNRHGAKSHRNAPATQPAAAARAASAPVPAASPAAVVQPHSPSKPALPQAADLLLVDDSAVARAKLRKLFESAGYEVDVVCDGVEALAALEKGRYGMMITDLEMPNMDGVTLINTCLDRADIAGMPILAVSGHESLRAKFKECRNIAGVHRKPWVDDILLSHVATLVTKHHERQPETV